ncbi:MAG: FlgD immunoglobulin-like domain containing protein [bacterium]
MKNKILLVPLVVFMYNFIPTLLWSQFDWEPYENNPVIDENFDPTSEIIFRPSVIFDGVTYHMWYGKSEEGMVETMGYATSPDGIDWTLIDAHVIEPSSDPNRFDSEDASQGWVIADGDTFKMWYWGNGPNIGNIGYAWSIDAVNWTKVNGPGMDGSVYDRNMDGGTALALVTPCVVKDGDIYHMWYSRVLGFTFTFINRIAYARSSDGINWTNVPGTGTDGAVLDWGEPGNFDAATVTFPAVIKEEERFIMWYGGEADPNTRGLGCATSTDGINWTRISGNGPKGACFEAGLPSVIKQDGVYKMWYGIGGISDIVNYATSGTANDVEDLGNRNLPINFVLEQNYPNPFNPATSIVFQVPTPSEVSIKIYNLLGQEIRSLVEKNLEAGLHQVVWDGLDYMGKTAPTGMYLVHMKADDYVNTKKCLLLR